MADDAPADRGAGALSEAGGERLSQLLRRSHQQQGDQLVLSPCRLVLVPRAQAAGPDQPADVATYETTDRPLAAARAPSASASRRAVQRHDPRQEPSAVIPLAGLPRPTRIGGLLERVQDSFLSFTSVRQKTVTTVSWRVYLSLISSIRPF